MDRLERVTAVLRTALVGGLAFVTIGWLSLELMLHGRRVVPMPIAVGAVALGAIAAVLAIRRDRRDQARMLERARARRIESTSTLAQARALPRRDQRGG